VLQTAERGWAHVICSNDKDFHDPALLDYCAPHGIEVCHEEILLARVAGSA
jgi:hypothetical protein